MICLVCNVFFDVVMWNFLLSLVIFWMLMFLCMGILKNVVIVWMWEVYLLFVGCLIFILKVGEILIVIELRLSMLMEFVGNDGVIKWVFVGYVLNEVLILCFFRMIKFLILVWFRVIVIFMLVVLLLMIIILRIFVFFEGDRYCVNFERILFIF